MDKNQEELRRKKAVALQYRMDFAAPKVMAQGSGHLAQKIIDTAKDANVKLYKHPGLVDELSKVDLGAEIPPELYEIVAQILVFVDDLDKLAAMRESG